MKYKIAIKRIYAAKDEQDGTRILVDRILPHGRDLHDLEVDSWYSKASPSSSLKRQLQNGEVNWQEFSYLYRDEIHQHQEKLASLLEVVQQGNLTLLTAEREPEQTWLPLLKDMLELRIKNPVAQSNK